MEQAALAFIGSQNFTNFARVQGKNPYRNILAVRVEEEEGFVFFEVKAESFLWHQVRCMAAALYQIGLVLEQEDYIARLLEATADKPLQPAPAEGLILWDTGCGIQWTEIESGDRCETYLDHLIAHHALMGKVCRALRNRGT
jgi:tRNA pseudouridine38-40 synthase